MATETTLLTVTSRPVEGSRATRRLRRSGQVPGVIYGGGDDPVPVQAEARALRHALAASGAVVEVSVDGEQGAPVLVKDVQRDPVKGTVLHVDLLRIRLDRPIQATTILELEGAEQAPGVMEGGVLEQVTRELNVEALPNDIPDAITLDVSGMQLNDTLTLEAVTAPAGVTLLDDAAETVVATITPPRVSGETAEDLEMETEVVGEGEAASDDDAAGDAEAAASGDGEGGDGGGEGTVPG